MEAATDHSVAGPPPPEDHEEESTNNEGDILIVKVQALMDKITSSPDNPNPNVLHALASILETQEFRSFSLSLFIYVYDCEGLGHTSFWYHQGY